MLNWTQSHISILLITLTGFFQVQAQNSLSFSNRIDSLQTLLDSNLEEDTTRIIPLNNLARLCFHDFQFERGMLAVIEADRLTKKLSFKRGEGLYWRTMQELHYNTYRIKPYRVLASWAYEDAGLTEYYQQIQPSPNDRDYSGKVSQLRDALKSFKNSENAEMLGHLYYMLCHNLFRMAEMGEALTFAEKAEVIFTDLGQSIPLLETRIYKIRILELMAKEELARAEELLATQEAAGHTIERERALMYVIFADYYFWQTTRTELSSEYMLMANQILEKIGDKSFRIEVLVDIGTSFTFQGMPHKSVEYYEKALALREQVHDEPWYAYFYVIYGWRLTDIGEFDKAEEMLLKARELNASRLNLLDLEGQLLIGRGHYQQAIEKFYQHHELSGIERGKPGYSPWINYYLAFCFQQLNRLEESNLFGLQSVEQAESRGYAKAVKRKSCRLLYENYEQLGQFANVNKYVKLYADLMNESEAIGIANRAADLEIQTLIQKSDQEKMAFEQEKLEQEKANQNQRWWIFSIGAGLFSSMVVLLLLVRNNRNKQKANSILNKQKQEIENALSQLQAAQAQLIHSEKMASLGELTAGIAHEIQNPLNFVNNFSDVNKELVDELREAIKKGNDQEAEAILKDIEENEEKILHHGHRADAIVKGMLQHSRAGGGEKEPTDINELADEYLRLSYHGLRAKDKTFNADFKTELDPNLPKINVVPQDIGRVLLNLINNAFYAVTERAKNETGDYKPTVIIRTTNKSPLQGGKGGVQISVHDNGPGIPDSIKDKIFQPFFTTKSTGEGTGLGLSLSYDIVTKGHRGRIEVESETGRGTEFIITIPNV